MKKIYLEMLAQFKKANKQAREKMAKELGHKTAADFLAFLNTKVSAEPTKAPKAKKPKTPVATQVTDTDEGPVGIKETKHTVHNVHILDASGSMSGGKFTNAVRGINDEITELQKDDTVNYTHTFIHFSDRNDIKTAYFMSPIKDVTPFSGATRGATALYDAVGITLDKLSSAVPTTDKVLVKIFTDGGENNSTKWSAKQVEELISELEAKGYTVTFVGTKYDVDTVINLLKVDASNTMVHDNTAEGVRQAFVNTTSSTMSYSRKLKAGKDVSKGFYKETGKL